MLAAAWADALTGTPRVVLVAGEPGIGKTRLVEDLAEQVRGAGGLVAAGACPRLGSSTVPFAPFRAALGDLAETLGAATLVDLTGPGAALLPTLVPDLGGAVGATSSPGAGPAQGYVLDVVARLLQRVALDRPLMVVVEDLHWSDASTRDLVGYLGQAARRGRLLLVGTLRSEPEPEAAVADLVEELLRRPGSERLDLRRLTPQGVSRLMAAILGAAPDVGQAERVARRSEGVPFLVEELTAAEAQGERTLPEGLRHLALRRSRQLPATATAVLRAVASAGGPVGEDALLEVCELPRAALDQALRDLVDAGLVVADRRTGRLDVRHALLREAVEQDLLPGESAVLHGRWADLLDGVGGADHRAVIEAAQHRWLARDVDRAYPAAVRAAAAARSVPAYGEELLLLERALGLRAELPDPPAGSPDEAGLLSDAGRAARLAGRYPRALELLEQARTALGSADVDRLARVLWEESLLARSLGDLPAVEAAIESLVDELPARPTAVRAHALNALLQLQLLRRDPRARETLSAAVVAAERAGEPLVAAHLRVTAAGLLADRAAGVAEARSELDRAAEVATSRDDLELQLRVQDARARVLLADGRPVPAEEAAREGLAIAARRGSPVLIRDYLVGALVDALWTTGRWAEALTVLDDTLRIDRPDLERAALHARRGRLLLALGRVDAGAAAVAVARRRLDGSAATSELHVLVTTAEVELAVAQGLPTVALDAARAGYERHGERTAAATLRPLLLAATIAARSSGPSDRREVSSYAWIGTAAAALRDRSPAEPWDSLLAAETSGADLRSWQAALDAVGREGTPAPLRMQSLLGAALARLSRRPVAADDRAAAARLVDELLVLAGELGAGPAAAAARALAVRAGLRLAGAEPTPAVVASGLTAREQEVLRLVALGRSNGQIAAELVISVKTVSVHVSHLLDKLGVSSRGEAAALARAGGLDRLKR